ncbi:hypothetical protein EYZ11_010998 [Aspergillus tanneri]|uniref:Uncharacterized protein n=1 Tax=Aspergillus tanneri TaxID=1220188 RepID=A0A4V3UN29_9EURO|nr:hypothetical protein EYZ11_010998 [Aspergillus tanneri]
MLEECGRLAIMRGTPSSEIYLRNTVYASQITRAGAIISPLVPFFYVKSGGLEELVEQIVGHLMGLFGLGAENLCAETRGEKRRPKSS